MTSVTSRPAAVDTPETLDLRTTAHQLATAARIALLLFAAELALDTLPGGQENNTTRSALALAARVPAGESVDTDDIVETMQDEDDEGPVYYQQAAPPGPQAKAWAAISSALGTAAWQESLRQDMQPAALISGFSTPDSLDFSVDMFVGIPNLDWNRLGQATAWLREHASKAGEGWGKALRIDDLRHVTALVSDAA